MTFKKLEIVTVLFYLNEKRKTNNKKSISFVL